MPGRAQPRNLLEIKALSLAKWSNLLNALTLPALAMWSENTLDIFTGQKAQGAWYCNWLAASLATTQEISEAENERA